MLPLTNNSSGVVGSSKSFSQGDLFLGQSSFTGNMDQHLWDSNISYKTYQYKDGSIYLASRMLIIQRGICPKVFVEQ